jgi:ANTAR domain-containing protein/GAF domain-containing protein
VTEFAPSEVAELYAEVGRALASHARTADALSAVTAVAVQRVPGADAAGITLNRNGKLTTVAATSTLAERTDAIQYELGSGPCVDAVLDDVIYQPRDLRTDNRWPEFSRRVAAETGVLSMLSFRLFLEADRDGLIAGLNLYATRPDAFDDNARTLALLLATHGALAVAASTARERAENLERALQTSREIGIAIGVLMTQYKVTREQGFDLLRIASQQLNRKLAEIATEVADTGALPQPPRTR